MAISPWSTVADVTGVQREAMSTIEKSSDVNVPVRTADDQWTQLESFLQFMQGVEEFVELGDCGLRVMSLPA